MKVELLSHTPNPEELVASAAKLCYSPVGVEDLLEKSTPESAEKFLNTLLNLEHMSPLEHISFTFGIEGVSRTLTHQLVRHRIASYSQQSQRYVRLNDFKYIIPPQIEEDEEAKKFFLEAIEASKEAYNKITKILIEKKTAPLVEDGMEKEDAVKSVEKSIIEDARYIFPNACETKIVVTMNARTLLHFFKLRTCNRAQWEIRAMAIEMLRLVKNVSPTIFKLAGPGCVSGPCTEGNMTCGKIVEVRKFFREEI